MATRCTARYVGDAWLCVEPLGCVVIMFASVQGIWCLCIGVMLVAEYIADPSATVSVVITFRMVTDICAENAVSIAMLRSCCNLVAFRLARAERVGSDCRVTRVDMRGVGVGACGNRGFRFCAWREFKRIKVFGSACRLLRCLLSTRRPGRYRGRVGAG